MKAEDPKQPRQPWRFTVDGGEPFAFAGICTRKEWEDEEGSRRLALQLHDHHHDAERGGRQGPRPDAGDPARPRGRGGLAASPDLSAEDAVAMCVPLDARRMQSAPANPKLNKVGKGIEGPELLVAPA